MTFSQQVPGNFATHTVPDISNQNQYLQPSFIFDFFNHDENAASLTPHGQVTPSDASIGYQGTCGKRGCNNDLEPGLNRKSCKNCRLQDSSKKKAARQRKKLYSTFVQEEPTQSFIQQEIPESVPLVPATESRPSLLLPVDATSFHSPTAHSDPQANLGDRPADSQIIKTALKNLMGLVMSLVDKIDDQAVKIDQLQAQQNTSLKLLRSLKPHIDDRVPGTGNKLPEHQFPAGPSRGSYGGPCSAGQPQFFPSEAHLNTGNMSGSVTTTTTGIRKQLDIIAPMQDFGNEIHSNHMPIPQACMPPFVGSNTFPDSHQSTPASPGRSDWPSDCSGASPGVDLSGTSDNSASYSQGTGDMIFVHPASTPTTFALPGSNANIYSGSDIVNPGHVTSAYRNDISNEATLAATFLHYGGNYSSGRVRPSIDSGNVGERPQKSARLDHAASLSNPPYTPH